MTKVNIKIENELIKKCAELNSWLDKVAGRGLYMAELSELSLKNSCLHYFEDATPEMLKFFLFICSQQTPENSDYSHINCTSLTSVQSANNDMLYIEPELLLDALESLELAELIRIEDTFVFLTKNGLNAAKVLSCSLLENIKTHLLFRLSPEIKEKKKIILKDLL